MTAEPNTSGLSPNTNPVIKKRLVIISVVFLIVSAIIAIGLYSLFNNATKDELRVSNQLINAVQAKDSNAAFSLFSPGAQKVTDKTELKTVIDRIGPVLNSKEKVISKSISTSTDSGTSGKVTYQIKGSDGLTYNFTVMLVKESGAWKVLNFTNSKK